MNEAMERFLGLPISQKLALLIVLMAVLSSAWYFQMFEGVRDAISAEKRRTPTLNKELAEEKAIEKNLAIYKAEIDQLRRERDEMRDKLPEKAEIPKLLKKIESKAKTISGLQIMKFERGDEEPEELYARIPVRMVLKGNFSEIATFFYYVSQFKRIVNVENISLTVRNRDKGLNALEAVCTATTFQYIRPKPSAQKKGRNKKKKGGGH